MTLWTDRLAHLVLTDPGGSVMSHVEIESGRCPATVYRESVLKILGSLSIREVRVVWLLLRESFPYGSLGEDAAGRITSLPDDLLACWKSVDFNLLPGEILDGMEAWTAWYRQQEQLNRPGCGLLMSLDGRGYFLGYGEKQVFARVSRIPWNPEQTAAYPAEDWIQQTRMLYRNRTGYDLGTLYFAGNGPDKPALPVNYPVKLEYPDVQKDTGPVPLPVQLLAQSPDGATTRRLAVALLDYRRNSKETGTVLRWGSGFLLLGWMVFLAGACQRTPIRAEQVRIHEQWEQATREWNAHAVDHSMRGMDLRKRRAEYLLVGEIGRLTPDTIEVERIRMQRAEKDKEAISISLYGRISGGSFNNTGEGGAARVFNGWMEDLCRKGVFSKVGNLRLDPAGEITRFQIEGETSMEGPL